MLIHSSFEHEIRNGKLLFDGWDAPVYHSIDFVFVHNICKIAVPLFFFISGFLFFIKDENFIIKTYIHKLKKRFKSLFIPYIVWNMLVLLLYMLVQNLIPSMTTGRNKLISDYTIHDYIMSFWSMSFINKDGVSGPIDSPLWFVRDLMVMSLLSPLIYWIIQKTKLFLPLFALVAYVLGYDTGIHGLSTSAIFFFSIGAFCGINKIDFGRFAKDNLKYTLPLYIILIVLACIFKNKLLYIDSLSVMGGILLICGVVSFLVSNCKFKIKPYLSASTFFIFASHNEVLKVFVRLASKYGIQSDIYYCIAYFICPFITLCLLLSVYRILSKYTPRLASVLSGGR